MLLIGITATACKPKTFTVTFDSQGGSAVAAIVVEKDAKVTEPADPVRPNTQDGKAYTFTGWFTDAAATQEFDFDTPITADITLYAGWTLNLVVRFNTKTSGTVNSILLPEAGGTIAAAPTAPTREGYRFGGWFYGRPGMTWLEPTPVSFPLTVTSNTLLHAYWEPLNSKTVNYSDDETYFWSLTSDASLIINPLVYRWSHETQIIDMLATPMFSTEVDWETAMDKGIADFPGDFSKVESGEFNIDAFDYHYILVGATHYPKDSEGDEHLTQDGKYDFRAASSFVDTEWTYTIREDLKFEDGTPITAQTYEYSLKQYLDPVQNNYRSTIYYRTTANRNGYPILNAYEYYTGTKTWDEVGFEIINDYSFKITTFTPIAQSSAVGIGNMRLVQPAAYEASLNVDRTNSTYGTPTTPYVSYGPYIIKSWDENQKVVFNKNYEYVLKNTVNYKSQVIEIVDNVDQRMQLFAEGSLSVAGITQAYFAEYAEHPNTYRSWDGYPQYILLNLAAAREGVTHEQPTIMFDVRFRQAMFYGFDRLYYANNIYSPNTATLLPIPSDTKAYMQDALFYSESPNHLAVLEEFGITVETMGYIPTRAVTLFNAAYADWAVGENAGKKVQLVMATRNDEFSLNLVNYIKSHYETLFGADKFEIIIDAKAGEANEAQLRQWAYDISLNSIGYGISYGAYFQYPAFAFIGSLIGGAALGLSQPNDKSVVGGWGEYLDEIIEIDLTATYDYLMEIGEEQLSTVGPADYLILLGWLEEETDELGVVTKPAGIYKGDVWSLAFFLLANDTPYDGTLSEPFPGATLDTWRITAAFERIFLEYVTMIPTVTRSSMVVYADNVVILWPVYSTIYGWGAARYRYLNTDPDFADGLYFPQ